MNSLTDMREVVGVDTHVHTHSAAAIDAGTGCVLGEITVDATVEGYAQLVQLAGEHAVLRAWAIEGTGSHGARHLTLARDVELRCARAGASFRRRSGQRSDALSASTDSSLSLVPHTCGAHSPSLRCVLHLLVDTSTWLDLSKRRDGQRWIVAMDYLVSEGELELLVPAVIVDEFERNRVRVETSMTTTVAQRFKLMKQDLGDYGGDDYEAALKVMEGLSHEIPLIGAMTTRNFNDVLKLMHAGRVLEPTAAEHLKVVQRGLDKRAPFHRSRNSVADALLIELYATALNATHVEVEHFAFVTSNSDDFSLADGDNREPHADIADLFTADDSTYGLGVDGMNSILVDHFGDDIEQLLADLNFTEDPRRLGEITDAEQEMFDRIWYHRSLHLQYRLEEKGATAEVERLLQIAASGRARVEATYTEEGQLGPYTDFELGMLNGKMSALRWVLGSEWDFLDT